MATVGGLPIAALDRAATAELMIQVATKKRSINTPIIMSSANGEVLSRRAKDPRFAETLGEMDLISADGQPLVIASRMLCRNQLPERVATTDLFHDVAKLAISRNSTFYIFGATEAENQRAKDRILQIYPGLKLIGHCHGYLCQSELVAKVDEINRLAPDVMWVALGLPHEHEFCVRFRSELSNVGVMKTSGGLFNFLSGTRKRAPFWMQATGLEWAYRVKEEPRRLFWRYATTNPHAAVLLLTQSN